MHCLQSPLQARLPALFPGSYCSALVGRACRRLEHGPHGSAGLPMPSRAPGRSARSSRRSCGPRWRQRTGAQPRRARRCAGTARLPRCARAAAWRHSAALACAGCGAREALRAAPACDLLSGVRRMDPRSEAQCCECAAQLSRALLASALSWECAACMCAPGQLQPKLRGCSTLTQCYRTLCWRRAWLAGCVGGAAAGGAGAAAGAGAAGGRVRGDPGAVRGGAGGAGARRPRRAPGGGAGGAARLQRPRAKAMLPPCFMSCVVHAATCSVVSRMRHALCVSTHVKQEGTRYSCWGSCSQQPTCKKPGCRVARQAGLQYVVPPYRV